MRRDLAIINPALATNNIPGIVETQFPASTAPALVIQARDVTRTLVTGNVNVPAGTSVDTIIAAVNAGENWVFFVSFFVTKASAIDTTGFNFGLFVSAGAAAAGSNHGPGNPASQILNAGVTTPIFPLIAQNNWGALYPGANPGILQTPFNSLVGTMQWYGALINPSLACNVLFRVNEAGGAVAGTIKGSSFAVGMRVS